MKLAQFPRQPLVGMALAAMGGIVLADFFNAPIFPLCLTIAFLAFACLVRPRAWMTLFLVGAGFFALHLVESSDAPGKALRDRLGDQPRWVTLLGTVRSEPKLAPNDYTTFFLRLDSIDLGRGPEPSSTTVRVRWKLKPQFGDRVRLRGLIEPIPPTRNPGVFDFRAYLARRDVYDGIFVRDPGDGAILESGGGNFLVRLANRTRNWMEATLGRDLEGAPQVTAMINGMALGIRHETPNDIEEPFQQTGTLHLFAVAGLHVGIIARLLWIVISLLRLPRRVAAGLIIPALFFYSAITGFHVSSVRAATMAAFLLGGIFFERPVLALNSLAGAALVILAVDSNQLFTSGFQLSFAVVGAILLWQEPFFRVLLRPGETDPFLPQSLVSRKQRAFQAGYRKISSGISVSAAAWAGSLVFIIWYFYLVTPISLLANLTVVPVAFCLLAVGLMSLLSAPFSSGLSVIFNNANWSLASVILGLVQFFSALPAGHLYVERPHWPDGARVEITVLDAGPGAAIHLRDGNVDWLFDAGSARDYERFLRDYLHSRGIDRLDGLVLSHGDSLHIGGALPLLEEFRPRRVIDNPAPDRSTTHRAIIARLPRRELARAGDSFTVSRHVSARVLYPPPGLRAKAADDQALVIQLQIDDKFRVLLVSDSGVGTEQALLAQPGNLRSEILIKGQHHGGDSGSPAFLEAVRPQIIVASSVDFPMRERVPDDWARMVRERGVQLFRQDRTGAVRLRFFRREWRATGFLDQETFRSSIR
jgi:competence protein ComEC